VREYNPVSVDMPQDRLKEFIVNNLNAISASIKSILTQARINRTNIATNTESIANASLEAWTTANRPVQTNNLNVIGINTTTGNLNYTTDGGATWKNYDGTAA